MTNPTETELETIAETRARYFTPRWFAELLAGRLGFGDTFWIGNYGVQLFTVPAMVLVSGLIVALAPNALNTFLGGLFAASALWQALLLRALFKVSARTKARGGWAIAGFILTAISLIVALLGAYAYLFEGR